MNCALHKSAMWLINLVNGVIHPTILQNQRKQRHRIKSMRFVFLLHGDCNYHREHLAAFLPSFPESDREIVSGDNYTSNPPSVNDSIRFMQLSSSRLDAFVIENFNKIALNIQL